MPKKSDYIESFDLGGFEKFWADYPRKQAKKDAWKAWCQTRPSVDTQENIHTALTWQKEQYGWLESEEFIPFPATYLRNERWTDERRRTPRSKVGQRVVVADNEPL